jgi:hypothetical protein
MGATQATQLGSSEPRTIKALSLTAMRQLSSKANAGKSAWPKKVSGLSRKVIVPDTSPRPALHRDHKLDKPFRGVRQPTEPLSGLGSLKWARTQRKILRVFLLICQIDFLQKHQIILNHCGSGTLVAKEKTETAVCLTKPVALGSQVVGISSLTGHWS